MVVANYTRSLSLLTTSVSKTSSQTRIRSITMNTAKDVISKVTGLGGQHRTDVDEV